MGGEILLDKRTSFSTREKGPNDLVTDADIESQRAIHNLIKSEFPDHGFVGEEENLDQPLNQDCEFNWIVDPLDGTLNYVHGLQSYSVSVALSRGDQLIAGAVFDPVLNEMFAASLGSAATLNGNIIEPSSCQRISESLVVISLPGKTNRESVEVKRMLSLVENCRSIRRLGSAALNLCYVAEGRVDGYLATSVSAWDVAAGALILQQAGGVIRQVTGSQFDFQNPKFLAAASDCLWEDISQTAIEPNN